MYYLFDKPCGQVFIFIGSLILVFSRKYHKKRLKKLLRMYCTNIGIKLVFSTFKVKQLFIVKDFVPQGLRCINLLVVNVMPVTLAKPLVMSLIAFVSNLFRTRPLMYINISRHHKLVETLAPLNILQY